MDPFQNLKYPALLYGEGYIFTARLAFDLQMNANPRLEQVLQLADFSGSLFRVEGWRKIPPPRTYRSIGGIIFRAEFAEPQLIFERSVTPQTLATEVGEMIARHQMYGNSYGDDEALFRKEMSEVMTFEAFFETVKNLP